MSDFVNIPGSGLVAPIIALEVTSGGQFESDSPFVILGNANADADIEANTLVPIASLDEMKRLAGSGSMLAETYRVVRANAPAQEIGVIAVPDSGTARVITLTIDSVPASGGLGIWRIGGEPVRVEAATGDSASDVAAGLAAAINAYVDELTGATLCVTATAAAAVVTVTLRFKGALGNDLDFDVPVLDGTNILSGRSTYAQTTAGAGTADTSSALAALGDEDCDFLFSPFDDAANRARYETAFNDLSGRWGYGRQSFGHVYIVSTGTYAELTAQGLAGNDRHLTTIPRLSASGDPNPPWLYAGMVARVAPWLADGATGKVSVNQTGLAVEGLRKPRDPSVLPDYAARNALLKSGISTWTVQGGGRIAIDKLVTGYRTNPLGEPDATFRDIQRLHQSMYFLRKFRFDYIVEHGNKARAEENPFDNPNISTPDDVKDTLIHSHAEMVEQGVLVDTETFAELIHVKTNPDHPTRYDALADTDTADPLDVFAMNARLIGQYRRALAA